MRSGRETAKPRMTRISRKGERVGVRLVSSCARWARRIGIGTAAALSERGYSGTRARRRRINCPGPIRSHMVLIGIGQPVSREEREDRQGPSERANPLGVLGVFA